MATNITRRPGSARLTVTDTSFPTAAQVTFDESAQWIEVVNESTTEWLEVSFDGGTTIATRLVPGINPRRKWGDVRARSVKLKSQSGGAAAQVCIE